MFKMNTVVYIVRCLVDEEYSGGRKGQTSLANLATYGVGQAVTSSFFR